MLSEIIFKRERAVITSRHFTKEKGRTIFLVTPLSFLLISVFYLYFFYIDILLCNYTFCLQSFPGLVSSPSRRQWIYDNAFTVSSIISNALSHSSSLTISGGTIRMMCAPIAVMSILRSKHPCFTSTPEIVSSNSTPTNNP